jgi:Holliday junction resolvasome RuvABC endonuclease subunit
MASSGKERWTSASYLPTTNRKSIHGQSAAGQQKFMVTMCNNVSLRERAAEAADAVRD